jgi:RNA polymerase sigma-70 factor (ECF subfamily)
VRYSPGKSLNSSFSNKADARFFTFRRTRGFNSMARDRLRLPPPFEQIMKLHEREIMRYLLRVSGNREDAADLFQETWLRAYRGYPGLEPERDVRPWLYAIAVNLSRNRARDGARRARVIVADGAVKLAANTKGEIHRSLSENDGYATVHMRELISALPARQREALHLRYFAGLNYGEIAEAMDCSQQSARANVSQAVRKLKSMW